MIHRKVFKRGPWKENTDNLKEKVMEDINEWYNANKYTIISIHDHDRRDVYYEWGPNDYNGYVVFYMDKL